MAQQNYDGTVTLKTRGSVAYTPTSGSSIARSAMRGPGKLSGTEGSNGRLQRQKGAGYTGRSAYH
jgi:hypothetical protein